MTRIIPPDVLEAFIQSAGWTSGQEPVVRQPVAGMASAGTGRIYTVDEILRGKPFYSEKTDDDGNMVGVLRSLERALSYAGSDGIIVTMPELIAAKVHTNKNHKFWKNWCDVQTEENIGLDKDGRFCPRGTPVLVVVHGGGILTPNRIRQAYSEGLIGGSAQYTEQEFRDLLEGRLPDGNNIRLYPFEEIRDNTLDLPHQCGIVMPYADAQATESGHHKQAAFLDNPLVIARAGGRQYLGAYFDRAKDTKEEFCNRHSFSDRVPSVPQGRLLFLSFNGLFGDSNLKTFCGRFVGVAPKARSAR